MKQHFLILCTLFVLAACASKRNAAAAKRTPTENDLKVVQAKFPETTLETLNKGHGIFFGACTKCHNPKNIKKRSEKQWSKILTVMAPKAKINNEEKDAVFRYVMSVKLSSKK